MNTVEEDIVVLSEAIYIILAVVSWAKCRANTEDYTTRYVFLIRNGKRRHTGRPWTGARNFGQN